MLTEFRTAAQVRRLRQLINQVVTACAEARSTARDGSFGQPHCKNEAAQRHRTDRGNDPGPRSIPVGRAVETRIACTLSPRNQGGVLPLRSPGRQPGDAGGGDALQVLRKRLSAGGRHQLTGCAAQAPSSDRPAVFRAEPIMWDAVCSIAAIHRATYIFSSAKQASPFLDFSLLINLLDRPSLFSPSKFYKKARV